MHSFCQYPISQHTHHNASHQLTTLSHSHHSHTTGSSVVDMSLLWLWWVSHHLAYPAGWDVGRPFAYELTDTPRSVANPV